MSKALLSFSLTPVQSFIEAARTVRDLKAGSLILSDLTRAALEAGRKLGGTPLFPARPANGGSWPDSIPNLFLMSFDDEAKAKSAAEACHDAVRDRWKQIAQKVHDALDRPFTKAVSKPVKATNATPHGKSWDEGWCHQIGRFWDIQTLVLPLNELDTVLQKMLGLTGTTTHDDLGRQFKAMQALLAAKKMVRNFPGDDGIGRHKCAMMGELEQMGPAGLQAADEFWKAVASQPIEHIRLAPRDRLCAVSLVKRFAKLDSELKTGLSGDVPDTAAVATGDWWARARDEAKAAKLQSEFEGAVKALRDVLGDEADTERRYLLMDDLTEGNAAAIAERETGEKDPAGEVVEAFKAVGRAREALIGAVKDHDRDPDGESVKIGDPPRYYAILVQDGDHIGEWLSGGKTDGTVDQAFLTNMSRALQEYAGKVQCIVKEHEGYTVYAGGDDAVAMLPLSRALDCAAKLRCGFPNFAPNGAAAPTLSAGMVIAHHMYDLRSALRTARAAEKRAKTSGRNALGIALVKRSGGPVDIVLDWDTVPAMLELQKLFEAGLSDRWLNKVAQAMPALEGWTPAREAVNCIIGHSIKGLQLNETQRAAVAQVLNPCSPDEAEAKVRDHIGNLWVRTWDRLAARNAEVRGADSHTPDCPLLGEIGFAPAALQEFVHFGQLASFLTRGRD